MVNAFILMLHPTLGVLAILSSVWVIAETLHAGSGNVARIRGASFAVAGLIWLTYLVGGYWYLLYYAADKTLILAGPWPFAHSFVMEVKEHVFLPLLLLASYLPIAASNDLVSGKGARVLVASCAALIVIMGLAMEGGGAFVAMGAKAALLVR